MAGLQNYPSSLRSCHSAKVLANRSSMVETAPVRIGDRKHRVTTAIAQQRLTGARRFIARRVERRPTDKSAEYNRTS
jgi:hypothetical protein